MTIIIPPVRHRVALFALLLLSSGLAAADDLDHILYTIDVSANHTLKVDTPASVLSGCRDLQLVAQNYAGFERYLPLSTPVTDFPAGDYCFVLNCNRHRVQPSLQSSPSLGNWQRGRRCQHIPGIQMQNWNVFVDQTEQVSRDGPLVQVDISQHGDVKFDRLMMSYSCGEGATKSVPLAADKPLMLRSDSDCLIQYNSTVALTIEPDVWFCISDPPTYCPYGNCIPHPDCFSFGENISVAPRPAESVAEVRVAARPPSMAAWYAPVAVLLLLLLAGLVWWRHRRHNSALAGGIDNEAAVLAESAPPPGKSTAGDARVAVDLQPAAAPSVLLVHCASAPTERTAVAELLSALRAAGIVVTDALAPARADRWLAEAAPVPADARVLVLTTAAAALSDAGVGRRQRQWAAAVRLLAAGALSLRYRQLFQARLGDQLQPVSTLAPGVVYTLPQHTAELLTALSHCREEGDSML